MVRKLSDRESDEVKGLLRNDRSLGAVKVVKEATGLNLKEAYELVQKFPEWEAFKHRQERLGQPEAGALVHDPSSTIH
jgi:ribosomal protein L7/L12